MSIFAIPARRETRHAARFGARHETTETSTPQLPGMWSKPLPVVWHAIVDIPADVSLAFAGHPHTGLSMAETLAVLFRSARRSASRSSEAIVRAAKVLNFISFAAGASDWHISVSSRRVRAERDDIAVEQLERSLLDHGFTYADFTVRVEYARAWGML
ncbi:MAG: hypothetical protein LKF49_02780 [Bifidobacterium tibiigranuli]|uniref:hypothetical protein n=1 Tax=Bifidobacterium tibiigranuli TaxID=2172043 RepID=UPI0023549A99|nr:hypothetical protein [Bifidobacterium tibiigranuli]MCH3975837.1 hypothetical protein [Bifidobacterium tibiigranuli]MCH4189243.1 hypothetical protein [Bifidobacterium tibiigranuli]MCH4203122.1 hypothetical protein [Bifidobacterium tibiigranuli]MCH4274729.1 hypothetical protein [Bifidobacterium tibiigranuli]